MLNEKFEGFRKLGRMLLVLHCLQLLSVVMFLNIRVKM